jgi:oligopeptide/dipeptide ABC transporter ATP-binding protein
MSILEVDRLSVSFMTPAGEIAAVRNFSLAVGKGECVGIVGESGAGKSQAFLAMMGLLPRNARVSGSARFSGGELLGRSAAVLDRIRGSEITMVFQDPLTSLTPHLKIGAQLAEPLMRHRGLSSRAARLRSLELLSHVHIADPARRLGQYPHELSGGMRQRVMIAMALACEPVLLIADEPTTALDVTIQAQILALLLELKRERGMSMVLITHDLGVVAGLADRVAVMQGGEIVELADTRTVLKAPAHAHTQALLSAMPRLDQPRALTSKAGGIDSSNPLLDISQLRVQFSQLRALDEIDLQVNAGEAVGIVGESGSGKSTLARAALQLLRPSNGHIVWLGRPRPVRRELQIVFQDPLASLDPRMTVCESVIEPLRVHRRELTRAQQIEAATEILARVGLSPALLQRYPHELSGGQCQRVGIARAMILKPKLLVCDEAVSALDVTTQAQVVALLEELRREYGLALLFISHNLAVIKQLCDRVLVLYLGRMMEHADAALLYESPAHPYTRALLNAIPVSDPDVQPARLTRVLGGELPSPLVPPSGCVFHTRCPYALEICRNQVPLWEEISSGQQVACHRWKELRLEEN